MLWRGSCRRTLRCQAPRVAFVANGDSLILLDSRSGAVSARVPMPIGTLAGTPVAVAVDEQFSRVFVANVRLARCQQPLG
jgi:hypothetical protein